MLNLLNNASKQKKVFKSSMRSFHHSDLMDLLSTSIYVLELADLVWSPFSKVGFYGKFGFKFNLISGAAGEYQTLLQQVTLPYVEHEKCQTLLRATRLGERFGLDKSFNCAGGKCKSIFIKVTLWLK